MTSLFCSKIRFVCVIINLQTVETRRYTTKTVVQSSENFLYPWTESLFKVLMHFTPFAPCNSVLVFSIYLSHSYRIIRISP